MTPEQWSLLTRVFEKAIELAPEDRAEYIRNALPDDSEVLGELKGILLYQDQPMSLLDEPLFAPCRQELFPDLRTFQKGEILLDQFRIERFIRGGGMGEVYEAWDLGVRERVAIKTIRPEIAADPLTLARFRTEILLARRVTHPNVCRIHNQLTARGVENRPAVAFLTMEFLDGPTLSDRIRQSPIPPKEAEEIVRQLCAGLEAAHSAQVVHRDFKSGNVILVSQPGGEVRAVITDFGLAHDSRQAPAIEAASDISTGVQLTRPGTILGTWAYMAPEQFEGGPVTPATDLYALGIVIYEMLTGALPFRSEHPTAAAIQRARPPAPVSTVVAGIPKHWDGIVARCLRYGMEKPFESAAEISAALRDVYAPVRRRVKTKPVLITVAAACILLGAFTGWSWWTASRPRLPPEALALSRQGEADNAAGAYFAATKALQDAAKLAPRDPIVRARLAEAWVGLDMPEKAAQEMLLVRRESLSYLPAADRLLIEAIDLSITRDFASAAAKYRLLTRLKPESAVAAVDLGRAYEIANRPSDAVQSYLLAAQGAEHSPAAWLRLGVLYGRQASYVKSNEAFAQAERLYQLTSNLEGLTELSIQRGIAANAQGNLDSAAGFLTKALSTARAAGNLQEEISATLRLSTNAYLSGNSAAAGAFAREALELASTHHLDSLATRGLVNLGNAFLRKRDFTGAESHYRQALELANHTGSAHLVALSMASLASLHDATKQREESAREAQQALAYYEPNHYARESSQCQAIIARYKRDAGDYEGALIAFRGQLESAERIQDRAQLSLAHEGIASMLWHRDLLPEALEHYRNAVEFAADSEHASYAELNCANLLWRLGRYAEAAAAFATVEANAKRFPALTAHLQSGRAEMLLSQKRFRDAADSARAALASDLSQAPDVRDELNKVLGLALVGMGKKSEGRAKCEVSQAGAESRKDLENLIESGMAILDVRIEQGEKEAALAIFRALEPKLVNRPELQWRARALASMADSKYAGSARKSLEELPRSWGDSAYTTYLTRPDIQKLSWPLLHPDSASH